MRRHLFCVLMIPLVFLSGCGGGEGKTAADRALERFQNMTGAEMEAAVHCTWNGEVRDYLLRCTYQAKGESTVEVLQPEELVGVRAILDGESLQLAYEDLCLDAGELSNESISPAACVPRLLDALRCGWLLEENRERLQGADCLRLTVDTTGTEGGKILWTVWLEEVSGVPVAAEIWVDEEIIFQIEFTSFVFYDIISQNKTESER